MRAWRRRAVGSLLTVATALLLLAPAAVTAASDRDGDGLRDAFEVRWGVSSPSDRDTDGDGIVDPAEDGDGDRLSDLGEQRFGTDPGARDSDADGRPDGSEDSDRDGRSDALEQDQRPLPAGLRPSLARAAQDLWSRQDDCGGPRWGDSTPRRCWFGDPAAPVTVAVVGDSKATMLMPPVIEAARQRGWRVVTPPEGCLLAGARDHQPATARLRRRTLLRPVAPPRHRLARDGPPGHRRLCPLRRLRPGRRWRGHPHRGQPQDRAWEQGAAATVAQLPEASAVLWLGDVPHNDDNPVRCLADHRNDLSACATRRERPAAREAEAALRRGATGAGARFAPLHDQACTYDPCPLVQGRRPGVARRRPRHGDVQPPAGAVPGGAPRLRPATLPKRGGSRGLGSIRMNTPRWLFARPGPAWRAVAALSLVLWLSVRRHHAGGDVRRRAGCRR